MFLIETFGMAREAAWLNAANGLSRELRVVSSLRGFADAARKLTGTMGTVLQFEQRFSRRHRKQHWSVEESENLDSLSIQGDSQAAAQLARTQKLALLKLTALMDRYSPSSKQGWNW